MASLTQQVKAMAPRPLYRAEDMRCAYQLRYGWAGWPSKPPFPTGLIQAAVSETATQWESDGLRVLESSISPEHILLTLSTTPQVAPLTLAPRVKGRLQHYCRRQGKPVEFSRKLAVRSIGDPTRTEVEAYIRNQVANEWLVDERFREVLARCTTTNPAVDLSQPTETNSGRYWYNLHLVLVVAERHRIGDAVVLEKNRDTVPHIGTKKGYSVSTSSVLADHLHIALRGTLEHSPETIALAFLNNLAFALGQRAVWQAGYYVGTFGEYSMAAVRREGTTS